MSLRTIEELLADPLAAPRMNDVEWLLKQPQYDRNNLSPLDAEARKHDADLGMSADEIEELFEEMHADVLSGRLFHGPFAFNSADYATEKEAKAAHTAFLEGIFKEVMDELAAERALDAARKKRR